MNLPNKITIARIIFVPIMVLVPFLAPYIGLDNQILYGLPISNIVLLILFLIASITDFLDGHIARKRNMVTNFGKFLDPIADKLLVFTALIMLVETNIIPGWIPIIIAAREFMVSAIRMVVASEGTVIAASMLGKVKTVTQMVAISLAFLDINPFMSFMSGGKSIFLLCLNALMSLAMIVCVVATIWSGIDYFMKSKDVILKSK
ncbi:MAG: CDP-diacylglycerol--glycerol-3-phosphate 3-phosphatidyltransferase [Clostridia bacterium]|nr:CDP-diacylglycerol--glycerol-3-phosphate 3-phosphatidyltransferase [Clostridia bacterium]